MKTIIHSVVALCNSLKSGRCLKIWAGRNILSQKYSPLPNKLIQVLTILLKLLLFVFKGLLGFMKVFLFLQHTFELHGLGGDGQLYNGARYGYDFKIPQSGCVRQGRLAIIFEFVPDDK